MKILLLVLILITPVLRINSQTVDTLNTGTIPQDTTASDTNRVDVDSLKLAKARPLIPLFPQSLSYVEEDIQIISRREIIYNQYSYTGDLLEQFPLAFQRHLGVTGQPHELLIYGNGFNSVSYLIDGILVNNRFTNSLDLNYVQSEAIDSIEIIPSPRAFLYGTFNNSAAVNFIPRENYTIDSRQGPFSRIRYYQAPNEEAMIDAVYRTYIARRLVGIFEMTNYSAANRFPNSGHGSWKFRTDLNYLLSDNFNLKAGYNYNRTHTRLFGGVNVDSLNARDTLGISELTELTTPVNHPTRYQKYHQHQFNIMLRNKDYGPFSGKVDLYYINSLTERRENERENADSISVIFSNDKYQIFGALFDQRFRMSFIDIHLLGGAEKINYNQSYVDNLNDQGYSNDKKSIYSVSGAGRASLNLIDNKLNTAIFVKYLNYNSKAFYGIGSDAILKLNDNFSFYGGLSQFTKPYNHEVPDKQTISSYEMGAGVQSGRLNINLKAYNQYFKDNLVIWSGFDAIGLRKINRSVTGIGVDLDFSVWKIFLETHSAYYNDEISVNEVNTLPDFTSVNRIYFKDTLFNANLFLKTGIEARYSGKQDYFNYGAFSQSTIYFSQPLYFLQDNISSAYTLDFFLTGEIRRRAVIYFTFENILDKQQFMVPGYPLSRRGLRLAVSWEFLN